MNLTYSNSCLCNKAELTDFQRESSVREFGHLVLVEVGSIVKYFYRVEGVRVGWREREGFSLGIFGFWGWEFLEGFGLFLSIQGSLFIFENFGNFFHF